MLVVADNITVTNPLVADLVSRRDGEALATLVTRLEEAGSDMIDLNLGFRSKDGPEVIRWLVHTAAHHSSLPLCLDTADPGTMRAGLEESRALGLDPRPLINSFSLDPVKTAEILPLAAEFGTGIVGFCVREVVPKDPEERIEAALRLVDLADKAAVARENLYLDPILFPLSSFQEDLENVVEFLRALPELFDPPVKSLVGLSNVAYGVPTDLRSTVEGTILPLLTGLGLDAVMMNVLNPDLRNTLHVVRAVRGETVFSPAELEARGASRQGVPPSQSG